MQVSTMREWPQGQGNQEPDKQIIYLHPSGPISAH